MNFIHAEIKVDGMICPQCEEELCSVLLHTRGILGADASYRKSLVTVDYDPDIISRDNIIELLKNTGYPEGGGRSGLISDLVSLAAIAILYFIIPLFTGLVNLPDIGGDISFLPVFIIGLLTGVHCIGMCGGIMLSTGNAAVYNAARLVSYTAVGAAFGAAGKAIAYDIQTKSMILTMCGILVVLIGLRMWGVPILREISILPKTAGKTKKGPIVAGLLTGLMPCGSMSSMWVLASSAGSALKGAEVMLSFCLGTCVFMMLFGMFEKFIPKKYNRYILKASTVLIVALGLILITKGIRLL